LVIKILRLLLSFQPMSFGLAVGGQGVPTIEIRLANLATEEKRNE